MHRYPLFLTLLALGCSNPAEIDDAPQTLIVESYLSPGQDPQVTLRQTLQPDRFYQGLEEPASGAEVEISVGQERFVLAEDSGAPGTYQLAAGLLSIESGKTYRLQVRHQNRQLSAATTVPFPARITEISEDTVVYQQFYAELFGDLLHPGEFRWTQSPNAAGYVIRVEAIEVKTLPVTAEPLTGDLDTLIARRARLEGQVSADSLAALDRQIQQLRDYFAQNVSLARADGDTIRWLRDRQQEDWDEIDGKDWSEGRKWRERRQDLLANKRVDYWIPADTLRSDYWWAGIRFEGEYEVVLHAADRNYYDYFTTAFNGFSGDDGDNGPLFHVEGGLGVFGSYAEDKFRVLAVRGEGGRPKMVVKRPY